MAVVPSEPATAQQALHRAMADNSAVTGWKPQHRIQFYHSRGDMVVPFGNYESFRAANPEGENSIYRLNDTFAFDSDHMNAAILFFAGLSATGGFAAHYEWLCEYTPTRIDTKRLTDTQHLVNGDSWYTLDGRRLSGQPTTKGVYISNNRKVVIK